FTPDGSRLVIGAGNGVALCQWDFERGITPRILKHPGWVRFLTLSPDGARLATTTATLDTTHAKGDERVMVWDVGTGRLIAEQTFPRSSGLVRWFTGMPTGDRVVWGTATMNASI